MALKERIEIILTEEISKADIEQIRLFIENTTERITALIQDELKYGKRFS